MSLTAPQHLEAFAKFIQASPSSFHAAAEVAEQLRRAGFTELDETKPWDEPSGGQFFVRDGAVIAWRVPETVDENTGFRVVGSHTDSPSFKLKPTASSKTVGWHQTGVEVYGGPLLNSWLDRELGLAGRLTTLDGESHLVKTGAIMRIPQLAIHLDRTANEALKLAKQTHMHPVWSVSDEELSIERYLCELAGVGEDDLVHHDVVAYVCEGPGIFGAANEFFAAPRMDNLSSVHASLEALKALNGGSDIAVLAAFDHEEIGSATRSGAAGPILEDALRRVAGGLGVTGDEFAAMMARSSCISADAGHAVHPNYWNMHDPNNRPLPNRGPLLKINANQRYATDSVGSALWARACAAAEVPTQPFVSNNAVPCGSTIGPITATRLGIRTVDVGIPLLSMHSAREMCGVLDPWFLSRALNAYWAGA